MSFQVLNKNRKVLETLNVTFGTFNIPQIQIWEGKRKYIHTWRLIGRPFVLSPLLPSYLMDLMEDCIRKIVLDCPNLRSLEVI